MCAYYPGCFSQEGKGIDVAIDKHNIARPCFHQECSKLNNYKHNLTFMTFFYPCNSLYPGSDLQQHREYEKYN